MTAPGLVAGVLVSPGAASGAWLCELFWAVVIYVTS
jgi:hypothetical protein